MKTITVPTQAMIATKLATKPTMLLEVVWGVGNTKYYGEATMTNISLSGYLLEVTGFNESSTIDNTGSVSQVSVTLDDTDGSLKTLFDTQVFNKLEASVYLYYDSLGLSNAVRLFKGFISGNVTWDDATRQFTLEIDSLPVTRTIGFALEEDDAFSTVPINPSDSAIGKAWPLCFGSVLRVPAVKISEPAETTIEQDVAILSTTTTIKIDPQDNLPATESWYNCNGILIQGTVADAVLTITTGKLNASWLEYWGISDIAVSTRVADADELNTCVLWISPTKNLVGKSCFTGTVFSSCYKQVGNKCWFRNPMFESTGSQPATITDVRGFPVSSWMTNQWTVCTLTSGQKIYWMDDTNKTTSYVANLFASSSIKEVMAYREIKSVRKLVAVPSSYYTKYLTHAVPDRYLVDNPSANTTCTMIEFSVPLSQRDGENWDDSEIFVTLVSTKTGNTADCIKTLLDYYSGITSDNTSQVALAGKLTNYPSHFALTSNDNVVDVIKTISWQARSAVRYQNGTAYYSYVSESPTSLATIAEANTTYRSLSVYADNSLDLVTKGIGVWRRAYTDEDSKYIKTNNVSLYGLKSAEYDFSIYNIESLVKKSLDFWIYRYSNVWKHAKLSTVLPLVGMDVLDCISLGFASPYLASSTIKAICESIDLDASTYMITSSFWTCVKTGTLVADSGAWVSDAGDTLPDDPTDGLAEVDYVVEIEYDSRNQPSIISSVADETEAGTGGLASMPYVFGTIITQVSYTGEIEEYSVRIIDENAAAYDYTKTYLVSERCLFNNIYYTSIYAGDNLDHQPNTSPTYWQADPDILINSFYSVQDITIDIREFMPWFKVGQVVKVYGSGSGYVFYDELIDVGDPEERSIEWDPDANKMRCVLR